MHPSHSLAILVIGFVGAGVALLVAWRVRANLRRSLWMRAELSVLRAAEESASASVQGPLASPPALELELAFDERSACRPSRVGAAGEAWVRECVGRLQCILPGIQLEAPLPAQPLPVDVCELEDPPCYVVDDVDDVGALCATPVVADRPPTAARLSATNNPSGVARTPDRARAKTLILGSMQGLSGLDAPPNRSRS